MKTSSSSTVWSLPVKSLDVESAELYNISLPIHVVFLLVKEKKLYYLGTGLVVVFSRKLALQIFLHLVFILTAQLCRKQKRRRERRWTLPETAASWLGEPRGTCSSSSSFTFRLAAVWGLVHFWICWDPLWVLVVLHVPQLQQAWCQLTWAEPEDLLQRSFNALKQVRWREIRLNPAERPERRRRSTNQRQNSEFSVGFMILIKT